MPSPFPGMDPFIEASDWEDFHARFINGLADALVPAVRPEYSVRTERRLYIDQPGDEPSTYRADLAVICDVDPTAAKEVRQSSVDYQNALPSSNSENANSADTTIVPVEMFLPGPIERLENYLVIRQLSSGEIVTVIELLSPTNKRVGSEGRRAYLRKREEILSTRVNLIELDLLRGGARLPTDQPLPAGDYFAFVCRAKRRRFASVYAWPIGHRLPIIPVPLAIDDREVSLDLQQVFCDVYDRAGYDYSLKYNVNVVPPLSAEQMKWVDPVLRARSNK